METLRINTSQNIDIEQSIASVGERIVATLLDIVIMGSYSIILGVISTGLRLKSVMFIGMLPLMFYGLLSELAMNGQSWGKKIMKIKVIKIDGSSTSFTSYFLRWVISLFEIFASLGSIALITIIINQKGQRLGDIAANTTIIRLKDNKVKHDIIVDFPSDYQIVYPEVSRLSINDIYTIQEVIEILKSNTFDAPKTPIARKTRTAIEQKMNIKSDQNPIAFFETVLRDYNFINSRV